MRTALMQPYLFPYLGYFQLVAAVDVFIVFDTAQHVRRGWVHRNRIAADGHAWRWLGLPTVHAPRESPISSIRIADTVDVPSRFCSAMRTYDGAPFGGAAQDLVTAWSSSVGSSLLDAVQDGLERCMDRLGLDTEVVRASDIGLDRRPDGAVGSWGVRACQLTGADEYVNLPGGRTLYAPELFAAAGLGLSFIEPVLPTYDRGPHGWVPGLSILDVLAMTGPDGSARMSRTVELDTVVPPS